MSAVILLSFTACDSKDLSTQKQARLAYSQENYEEAIALSATSLATEPEDPEMLSLLSRSLIETKHFIEAISALSTLIQVSKDSSLLCYRGTCQNELGNFNAAERDFSLAIAFDSLLACAWYGRAKSRTGLHQFQAAIVDLNAFLAIDSLDAKGWNLMGMNYRAIENYDSAEFCYSKAIHLNEIDWMSYYNLSVAQTMHGAYDSALSNNASAITRAGTYRSLLYRERGKIFYLLNAMDSACSCWQISALDDEEGRSLLNRECQTAIP